MALFSYKVMQKRGYAPMRELPTFHWALFELVVFILIEEVGFYYSHRYKLNIFLLQQKMQIIFF